MPVPIKYRLFEYINSHDSLEGAPTFVQEFIQSQIQSYDFLHNLSGFMVVLFVIACMSFVWAYLETKKTVYFTSAFLTGIVTTVWTVFMSWSYHTTLRIKEAPYQYILEYVY